MDSIGRTKSISSNPCFLIAFIMVLVYQKLNSIGNALGTLQPQGLERGLSCSLRPSVTLRSVVTIGVPDAFASSLKMCFVSLNTLTETMFFLTYNYPQGNEYNVCNSVSLCVIILRTDWTLRNYIKYLFCTLFILSDILIDDIKVVSDDLIAFSIIGCLSWYMSIAIDILGV